MAYFVNASRQLLESFQGVRRTNPDPRKVRVGNKDYVWLPWQQQIGRLFQDFSENQQFYLVRAKVVYFSFVLSIYTECGNKVACSKDVLRYHLFRKYSVSKKNENSWTYILWSPKQALCGVT